MKKSVLGAEEDADKLELYNDSDCWAIDPDMTNSRRYFNTKMFIFTFITD